MIHVYTLLGKTVGQQYKTSSKVCVAVKRRTYLFAHQGEKRLTFIIGKAKLKKKNGGGGGTMSLDEK